MTRRLQEIPLFARCTKQELQEIARLTAEVTRPAGTVLCRQGDLARQAFVIVEGEVTVEVDGTEIARLGRGAVCGELALLDRGARTATVTALTSVRVLAISVPEFADLMRLPAVSGTVLASVAGRLRGADRRIQASTQATISMAGGDRCGGEVAGHPAS